MDMPSQNAAGLDMFVGSGLDYLSEVSLEDLDTDLLSSNLSPNLSQAPFTGFTPLAASLGTFGSGSRYMSDPHLPSVAQLSQLPFMPAAGNPAMASWSLGALTCFSCQCMCDADRTCIKLLMALQESTLVNLHSHMETQIHH